MSWLACVWSCLASMGVAYWLVPDPAILAIASVGSAIVLAVKFTIDEALLEVAEQYSPVYQSSRWGHAETPRSDEVCIAYGTTPRSARGWRPSCLEDWGRGEGKNSEVMYAGRRLPDRPDVDRQHFRSAVADMDRLHATATST